MANSKNKRENFIVAYFRPFGLRQICDIALIVGVILAIIGLIVNETLIMVGLIVFLVGAIGILYRNIRVLLSKINHKAPEYRNAIYNTCVVGVMFLLAVFGLIYSFVV